MINLQQLAIQRTLIAKALGDIAPEEWFRIPASRKNNLAWNLGHIVTVQQLLTYGRCGLPLKVPEDYRGSFARDTSPAGWTAQPDPALLLKQLTSLPATTLADHSSGLLASYEPYVTASGVELDTLDMAIAFNNFHEGIHLGIMLSMKRELRSA